MKLVILLSLTLISSLAISGDNTMKHNIQEEIKLSPNAKVVKVLSNPSFKIIGLGFKKDQVLEKHKTPSAAILIVQSGSVNFKMAGTTYELKAGDYFEIPANVEHEVTGREDSHLYLIK